MIFVLYRYQFLFRLTIGRYLQILNILIIGRINQLQLIIAILLKNVIIRLVLPHQKVLNARVLARLLRLIEFVDEWAAIRLDLGVLGLIGGVYWQDVQQAGLRFLFGLLGLVVALGVVALVGLICFVGGLCEVEIVLIVQICVVLVGGIAGKFRTIIILESNARILKMVFRYFLLWIRPYLVNRRAY